MSNIRSVRKIGAHQTYDLEVDNPDHQFYLANGVLTSNSHAISYAIGSYWCSWLMTYHEPQWMCAFMESQISSPTKRAKAMAVLDSFGYELLHVDINKSGKRWKILPGKKLMPSLQTVKGIGLIAIEEIQQRGPYTNIYDLLYTDEGKWKHSKLNKKCFEALIKVEALGSLDMVGPGKTFENYHHVWKVLIENWSVIKHNKHGLENLEKLLAEIRDVDDFPMRDKLKAKMDLMGHFDVDLILNDRVKNKLRGLKVTSIDEHGGKKALYWFILVKAQKRFTKGAGRPWQLLTVAGESGKQSKIMLWNTQADTELPEYAPCVAEVYSTDYGLQAQMKKLMVIGGNKKNVEAA